MNDLPDDLIRLLYSYIQNPKQMICINKNFFRILDKNEAIYRYKMNYKNKEWFLKNYTDFRNLTRLHCYNNLIELPDNFNKLTYLNCFCNNLIKLPDNLNNLTFLDCSSNNLIKLPDNLNNLTYLDCSDNQLTELPDNLNNLTFLDCSDNQFTELPDNIKHLI